MLEHCVTKNVVEVFNALIETISKIVWRVAGYKGMIYQEHVCGREDFTVYLLVPLLF